MKQKVLKQLKTNDKNLSFTKSIYYCHSSAHFQAKTHHTDISNRQLNMNNC